MKIVLSPTTFSPGQRQALARRAVRGRCPLEFALAAALAGAGCASVLGVDRQYVLGDGGELTSDGGAEAGRAPSGIRCDDGGTFCDPASQECCLAPDSTLSCVSNNGNACTQGTDVLCDDSADCDAGVCCINLDPENNLLGTQCLTACPGGGSGSSWLELCAPALQPCASGSCKVLSGVQPAPFTSSWFYACQ